MTMPNNLVLIRHGQSEANVMQAASKNGDNTFYTEDTMMVPDRSWRLTAQGVAQARTAGAWVTSNLEAFDRHIVSPFIRTRETAASLAIEGAQWEENRVVRERSWGDISSLSRAQFARDYPLNALMKKTDPLYWAAPSGESIANVAENRVRNLLNTLHRENEGQNVLVVSHGEFMWSTRLVLERWSDEEFMEKDADPYSRIHNCTVLHYTRLNPVTGERLPRLGWVRRAWPILVNGAFEMHVEPWEEFSRPLLSNEELLARAEAQEHRILADAAEVEKLRIASA